MAGIGPICRNSSDVLKLATRGTRLTMSDNELEIFYNLCAGRVFFQRNHRKLYYVDSPAVDITLIIQKVFRTFKKTPDITQLYMDKHKLLKAAFCMPLQEQEVEPVLVALRLSGIHVASL